jgi:hypothetical protein
MVVATEIADSSYKRQSPFTCARGLFTFLGFPLVPCIGFVGS